MQRLPPAAEHSALPCPVEAHPPTSHPSPTAPTTFHHLLQVKPRVGISALTCSTGKPIYAAGSTAVSLQWDLGAGTITWIGSSFFVSAGWIT